MRRRAGVPFALAALFGLLPAGLFAQSLGDVAEREQKKKEGQKPKPVRVYTDEDLKKARESGSSAVTVLPAPAGESSAAEESTEARRDDVSEAGDARKGWRARADGARADIKAAEARVGEIQARIDALTQDIEPNPEDAMDPNRLQKRDAARRKALEELDQAKEAVATAKKAYEDLEAEARRKSVPPGWLEP